MGTSRDASARIEGSLATGTYPWLARLLTEGKVMDTDERFMFGLERLLDGIAMHLSGITDHGNVRGP
ncbi:MAG: TetR/AcrR family transcriptional regulator C-terminal domain-containing protein [Chloroflexi bacterium]|nr:TetR/AcrR family transcriptional regulator C-terminal domain-containing protein [Chloroflexota bacterium]